MEDWQKAHAALKLLPLYDIPIIQPAKEEKKPTRRAVKKRNRFLRFLKKMVYYKPTTFIGTNLMVAGLTVFVQNAFSKPHIHHKPDKAPIVHMATEAHQVVQKATEEQSLAKIPSEEKLNMFDSKTYFTMDSFSDFITPFVQALAMAQDKTTVRYCDGCGDVIRYTTNSGNNVEVTCLTCQKPFQEFMTNKVQQIVRE